MASLDSIEDNPDIRRERAQVLVQCQLCPNKVELFCRSCDIDLCRDCSGKHALSLSSKSHDIVKYAERYLQMQLSYCSTHSTERNKCQFYCQDCNIPICVKCLKSENHKHHEFDDLEQVYNSKKEIILKETQIFKEDKAPRYMRIIDDIKNKMTEINAEHLSVKAEISARLQEWKHFVDIAIQVLHAKVDLEKEKDLKTLGETLSRFEYGLRSINQTILENEKSLQIPNHNLLSYIPKIDETIPDAAINLHLTNHISTPGGEDDKNKQSTSTFQLNDDPAANLVPPTPEEGFAFLRRLLKIETTQKDMINAEPNEESGTFIKSTQPVEGVIEDISKIPYLDQNEVSEISKIGEQHDVKMSLEKEKGVITLEGFTEEVINAKCKIHELLRNSSKKFAEQALINKKGIRDSHPEDDPVASLGSPDDKEQHSYEVALSKNVGAENVAVIKDALIPNLEPNELSRFDASPPWIKLTVQQQEGIITVEVVKEKAVSHMLSDVKERILNVLKEIKEQRRLDEETRMVAEKVQWSFIVKDQLSGVLKLEDYPGRQNVLLENAYQKNQKDPVRLAPINEDWKQGFTYVDFSTMRASKLSRPDQAQEVLRREKITEHKIQMPVHWTEMQVGKKIEIITLHPSSKEYRDIAEKFLDGVKTGIYNTGKAPNPANNPVGQFNNVKVIKIERIQNPSLYQLFSIRLDQIKKHVDEKSTKLVQTLWYGAGPAAIDDINHFGFNRSYIDTGEPWHGRGVYFASDASYMATDWLSGRDPSGKKKMYLSKVITGHYCAGVQGMNYPPERLTGINYDSAVNDLNNPMEFIIFNDTQAYPEYCIEFTI